MKFTCTQENLLSALDVVTPVTGKNLSLPILNNILIKTTTTEIVLAGTNLEIAITTRLRGKIEMGGEITVNGKMFRDFVSLQPNGKIECNLKDKDLHVNSISSKTIIKGVSSDEFPVIPTIDDNHHTAKISMTEFGAALQKITPTITLNESRPEISGLYMSFSKEKVMLVGTDSYRLAEYTFPLSVGSLEGSYIVPLRSIQEIQRVFSQKNVELQFTDTQFGCKDDETELVSRLIEGQYPDYTQIIPSGEKTTVSINRLECIQAVKATSLFCKSGVNDIEITTKKEEKLLVIAAANNQVGENITTIPATITGEDTTIIFNYRYVIDALSSMETEDILLSFNGPEATGVIKQTNDAPFIHLIMPIRQ